MGWAGEEKLKEQEDKINSVEGGGLWGEGPREQKEVLSVEKNAPLSQFEEEQEGQTGEGVHNQLRLLNFSSPHLKNVCIIVFYRVDKCYFSQHYMIKVFTTF